MILVVGPGLGTALGLALRLGLLAAGGTGQSRCGDRCARPFVALGEEGRRRCDGRCWDAHVLVHRRTGRRTRCSNAFPNPQAAGLQLITAAPAAAAATGISGHICGRRGGLIAVELQMVLIASTPSADIRCYGLHFGAIWGSIGVTIDLLVEGRYAVLRIQADVVDAEYPQGLVVLLLLLQLLLLLLLLMLLQVFLVRLTSLLWQLLLQ